MIKYICFFQNGQEGTFPHVKTFFDKYLNTDKNLLVIGPHIKDNMLSFISSKYYDKKILVIFEPVKNFTHYKPCYEIVENYKKYNLYLFGCVENKPDEHKIKFPLYVMERFPIYDEHIIHFSKSNNIVTDFVNNADIFSKSFCCLINRWDPDNHRTKMYNTLKKIKKIHCPSTLLNNCSNVQLNTIGKTNYIRNFLFNICSENYDNDTFNGYITEKLMDACLGGAIPIYAGWFDEYDAKIFNKKRIIFYNSKDESSFEKVYNQVKELTDDKEKLLAFYRQPVFCDTAGETIEQLKKMI